MISSCLSRLYRIIFNSSEINDTQKNENKKSDRPQVVEKVFQETLPNLKEIQAKHDYYKYLLYKCFRHGSFISEHCKSFQLTEDQNKGLATIEFEDQPFSQKKAFARIQIDPSGNESIEFEGHLFDSDHRAQFEDFRSNFTKIFKEVGLSVKELMTDETYLSNLEECRRRQAYLPRQKSRWIECLEKFAEVIQEYGQIYGSINKDRILSGELNGNAFNNPFKISEGCISIIDFDTSAQALLLSILLRQPHSMDSLPDLVTIKRAYIRLRGMREEFLKEIQRPEIKEYKLYSNHILVAEKVNGVFHIYEPKLYASCTVVPKNYDKLKRDCVDPADLYVLNPLKREVCFEEIDGKVVDILEKESIYIYKERTFRSCLEVPPVFETKHDGFDEEHYKSSFGGPAKYAIFDPRLSRKYIAQQMRLKAIPKGSQRLLKPYLGKTLEEAVYQHLKYNVSHAEQIFKNEIGWLTGDEYHYDLFRHFFYLNGLLNKYGLSQTIFHLPKRDKLYTDTAIILKNVLKFLLGKISMETLNITPLNAPHLLTMAKLCDLALSIHNCVSLKKSAFKGKGINLRWRILELMPQTKSFEVFTMTLHQGRMNTPEYLLDSRNWHPSRVGMYLKEVANNYIRARVISDTLHNRILAVRGNSCSGKSTFAPEGSLNVDQFKAALKMNRKTLENWKVLNGQIHGEVAILFEKFLGNIATMVALNYCLDSRLIKPEFMKNEVLDPARARNIDAEIINFDRTSKVAAEIIDFEVPLLTSLNRVLTRPTFGGEPCPSLEAIEQGFINLRKERAGIIKMIKDDKIVQSYELHCKVGQLRILVAAKRNGEFEVYNPSLYDECLREPLPGEIKAIKDLPITPESIKEAVRQHDIYPEQADMLKKWCGLSYAEAVDRHVNNKPPPPAL